MRYSIAGLLAAAIAVTFAVPLHQRGNLVKRAADEYDFVIVGGGLAGLVLGARLSEDAQHTVLVLEAGSDGSEYQNLISTPGLVSITTRTCLSYRSACTDS